VEDEGKEKIVLGRLAHMHTEEKGKLELELELELELCIEVDG
jgi:hypothetical protein